MRLFLVLVVIAGSLGVAPSATADHMPPTGYFVDDDQSVHEGSINALRAAGITKGCNPPANDRFCPSDSITRAQMATFLMRALDLPVTSADYFVDDSNNIHEAAINTIRAAGLTTGCRPSGEEFCPDAVVTRGQMAAFLQRGFKLPNATTDHFSDDATSIFEADINALAEARITVGCAPSRFCPDRPVSRGEMATFLTRAIPLPIPKLHDHLDFALPFSGVCDPQQLSCQITIERPVLDEYRIEDGWFYRGPFEPGDEVRFAAATFTVTLDGAPIELSVGPDTISGDTTRRSYTATLGALPVGTYRFVGRWIWDGVVLYQATINLVVSK